MAAYIRLIITNVDVPRVSPAGSVGASAFGRGVHRTPAPSIGGGVPYVTAVPFNGTAVCYSEQNIRPVSVEFVREAKKCLTRLTASDRCDNINTAKPKKSGGC